MWIVITCYFGLGLLASILATAIDSEMCWRNFFIIWALWVPIGIFGLVATLKSNNNKNKD